MNLQHEPRQPLRAGDVVTVKSESEILATLDDNARLDGMPFMPEMLEFCGKRFTVFRRADKTCDAVTTQPGGHIRRLHDTVHLEGLRCDGGAHGGCEAGCLIFWKEAWLTRVDHHRGVQPAARIPDLGPLSAGNTRETLVAATRSDDGRPRTLPIYSCQATQIVQATTRLPWWDLRQYVRDIRSGNIGLWSFVRGFLVLMFNKFQAANNMYIPRFQLIKGGRRYPFIEGKLTGRTPRDDLGLEPGELVEIKSREEIMQTLDENGENRGLRFGLDMVPYCGRRARVRKRVRQIIDEETGKMITMRTPCIILEDVVCNPEFFQFCPRAIYSYWREVWLKRVDDDVTTGAVAAGRHVS